MMAVQSTTAAMQVHEDLTALLARNLTISTVVPSGPDSSFSEKQMARASEPAPAVAADEQPPKIVYSISQHYHHSAHVARPSNNQEQSQRPHVAPEPVTIQANDLEIQQMLLSSGINPSDLSAVQLALFQMATSDRREYLVQLWRICPPVPQSFEAPLWGTARSDLNMDQAMEKEIATAQLRLQEQEHQNQQSQGQDTAMSLDGTTVPVVVSAEHVPLASAVTATQTMDGRWLQQASQSYMEPYMLSGYEQLSQREYMAPSSSAADNVPRSADMFASRATDPVYSNRLAPGDRASWPQATVDMENQYGTLMAMRAESEMEL